jgi:hypothetical protein
MGQKPRVGRPRKNVRRIELRLNADDPMVQALERESQERHTTLQQHITDILTARYLNAPPRIPEAPTSGSGAAALADEWM